MNQACGQQGEVNLDIKKEWT